MIIFLYGSDGYRLKENVDTIVSAYQKKHKSGLNLHCFDMERDKTYDDLTSALKSVSFFDEVKLVVIKSIFSNKIYSEKIASLIKDLNINTAKDTVLLFIENKDKKGLQKFNKEFFSVLADKDNIVREVEFLSGIKLSNWVKNKFKENGHNVTSTVVSLLINSIGNESWSLANEISKLSNYKKGGAITEKDVNLLVGRKEDNNIFDLVDAVGNQNKTRAFEMMFRLINSGHNGYYLLGMLVYQFKNLLSVSDAIEKDNSISASLVAKKCGLNPFVARKVLAQTKKFKKSDLMAKFNQLADLDVSSKSGQANLEDSLYNFVVAP